MYLYVLCLILIFFATTTNLGFFTPGAFMILTGILTCVVAVILQKPNNSLELNDKQTGLQVIIIGLLFFATQFYGGLYQEKTSLGLGAFVIGSVAVYACVKCFFPRLIKIRLLPIAIVAYIFLSWWTITFSPQPVVDSFVILKEAPWKLVSGINPYAAFYTGVYRGLTPDYFSYLPFSFFYTLPFVVILSDPRYGSLAANLISICLLWALFKGKNNPTLELFLTVFLFLPRSFYVLEHMYLDPIIFAAFLAFFYLLVKGRKILALFVLALFFSFKQHLFILLPLLLSNLKIKSLVFSKRVIYFLLPLSLIGIFFLISPGDFMRDVLFFYSPDRANTPIALSLSFPTFLRNYFPIIDPRAANYAGFIPLGILFIYLIRSKIFFVEKVAIGLFLFNFFTYQSYFNNYFLVSLFFFFLILLRFFSFNQHETK